ncbi:MAG: hypothetical protein PCFJNLEI_01094 [Verrucomicrobiae bacterium]|nr:hypothetical protein [Verrucomicrobiae bacterium]
MTEWDLQPRSNCCTACQKAFADKQDYHTLLSLTETGYQRRDLCSACYPAAERAGVVSYWQGEYKLPPPPPVDPIQKDTAESFLRKLVEAKDPTQAGACYILAVMLERKKILKHRDTIKDEAGHDLLVYEHAANGESFTVLDPQLRLDQLETVQRQVATLLQPAAAVSAPQA